MRTSRGRDLVDLTKDFDYAEIKTVCDVATPQEKKLLEPKLRREAAKERMKAGRTPGSTVPAFLRRSRGRLLALRRSERHDG